MYKRAVHYLQGSEWVEIQCACPERVLNLLGARGIVFWDLTWESEICLRLRILLRQEALLREIAEQTGAEITVMSRRGVPLLWARFRRRYVLLAGLAVFWLLLFLLACAGVEKLLALPPLAILGICFPPFLLVL